jgi:hypothetical protein
VVASLDNISSVEKVFGNGAAGNKSLVGVDEVGNKAAKVQGKALRVDCKTSVLK